MEKLATIVITNTRIVLPAVCMCFALLACTPAEELNAPRVIIGKSEPVIISPEDLFSEIKRNAIGQALAPTKDFSFIIDTSVSPAKASLSLSFQSKDILPEKVTQLYFRTDSIRADGVWQSISYNFDDGTKRYGAKLELTNKQASPLMLVPGEFKGLVNNFRIRFYRTPTQNYSIETSFITNKVRTGPLDTTQVTGAFTVDKVF